MIFLFTGVTRAFYRRLNKGLEQIIDWRCDTCRSQVSINVQARNNTLELTAESTLEVASNITDTIPHDNSHSLHDSSAGPSNRRHCSPSPQPQRSVRRRITSPAASIPSSPAHGLLDDPSHDISQDPTTSYDDDSVRIDISIEPVNLTQESSINDDTVYEDESYSTESCTTYQLVEGSTQRQGVKLCDSLGYTYTKKATKSKTSTTWRCTVRNKNVSCAAKVIQHGETYTPGCQPHIHPASVNAATTAQIYKDVKQQAKDNVFEPASAIVEDVYAANNIDTVPCPSLPKPANLQRCANRQRENATRRTNFFTVWHWWETRGWELLPIRYIGWLAQTSDVRHRQYAQQTQKSQTVVYRWDIPCCEAPVLPAAVSPCFPETRWKHQAGTSCVFPDEWKTQGWPCRCPEDTTSSSWTPPCTGTGSGFWSRYLGSS